METFDKLIGSRAVSKLFNDVSDMTIWRWCRKGTLPAPIKINGRNYWRASEVDAVIARAKAGKAGV